MNQNIQDVNRFVELTGASHADARTYLLLTENKLQAAVELYFSGATDATEPPINLPDEAWQNSNVNDDDEEGYRKPIPVKKMRLISDDSKCPSCC